MTHHGEAPIAQNPFDSKEWGDLHGEPPISREQFDREQAAEREYRHQYFTLRLTADELDWLFNEVLWEAAVRLKQTGRSGEYLDVKGAIEDWTDEVAAQGYRG